jgi:hypothetical protein
MTKDDIIRMAVDAGFGRYTYEAQSMLERFANSVAAHERKQWPEEMKAMERQVEILTDSLYKAATALQLAALRARSES